MMTRDLDFAAHHLAAARFGGQEDDQEIGLPDLRLDLPRPRLADSQPLIDEDRVSGPGQPGDDVLREGLIRLDVVACN